MVKEKGQWIAEFGLKVIAAIVAVLGGVKAYQDYQQNKDKDLKIARQHVRIADHDVEMKLLDYKLRVFGEVLRSAADVALSTRRNFGSNLDKFGALKHGELRMVADDEAYKATIDFWNAAVAMFNHDTLDGEKLQRDLETLAEAYQKALQREFGTEHLKGSGKDAPEAIPKNSAVLF